MPVQFTDVVEAARTIEGAVERTPALRSTTLSRILGADVVLKSEVAQFTASFKERGARNFLEAMPPEARDAGVVAVSAGNHAQGVAYHATQLGIPATIVMPRNTPFIKIARTETLGATVVLHGDTFEEALERGHELCEKGLTFVHPFDDARVIAGAGTVALEFLSDHPDLDALIIPLGGGGLISGCAIVAAELGKTKVFGVQSERFPSMARAIGKPVAEQKASGPTIAEGIAVKVPGLLTTPIIKEMVADVLTVSERALEDGVNLILEIEKLIVEGAGAAGIAALLEHGEKFAGLKVGVVLTGGNIDPSLLASIISRGLARVGRLSRLRITLDDKPGTLASAIAVVSRLGGNIIDIQHQRVFAGSTARSVEVEIAMETGSAEQRDAVIRALEEAGHPALLVEVPET